MLNSIEISQNDENKASLENIKMLVRAIKRKPTKYKTLNERLKKLNFIINVTNFTSKLDDLTNILYDYVDINEIQAAWDQEINEFKTNLTSDDQIQNELNEFSQTYNEFKTALKTFISKNKDQEFNKTLLTHVYVKELSVLWDESIDNQIEKIVFVSGELKDFTLLFNTVTQPGNNSNNPTSISLDFLNEKDPFTQQIIGYKILQDLDVNGIQTKNMKNIDIFNEAKSFKDNKQLADYNTFSKAFIQHKKSEAK